MKRDSVTKKRMPKWKKALIITLSILFALAAIFSFFMICDAVAHSHARVVPDYEQADLTPVLNKQLSLWTEEDYELIYRQTGLTKAYFESVEDIDADFILRCQDDLFYDGEISTEPFFFGCEHDCFTDRRFNMVPLKKGDVLILSSTHTFGWSNGHAAIVVEGGSAANARIVEAVAVGTRSQMNSTGYFRYSANFMVLRPKIDEDTAENIADWAKENLIGVDYSLFTGIFNAKDQGENVTTSQCAHLVWQAYKAFGYDIDSTGGPVVSVRNIANCDLFDVVQANGFDLEKLWS